MFKSLKSMYRNKGELGYIRYQKVINRTLTIALFAVVAIIFVVGLLVNNMNSGNLFTIIAALFVIPAAKFAVSCILFHPFQPVEEAEYNRMKELCKGGSLFYTELALASTERAYSLDYMVVTSDKIFGLARRKKDNPLDIRNYLQDIVSRKGNDMTVVITDDTKKFENFLKSSTGPDDVKYETAEDKEYFDEERARIVEAIEVVFI